MKHQKKKEDRNKERNLECDIGSKERVSDTKQGPSNSQPVQKQEISRVRWSHTRIGF